MDGRVCTVRVGGQGLHLPDMWAWRKGPVKSYWEVVKYVSQIGCAKSQGSDAFWIRNTRELETLNRKTLTIPSA